MTTSTRKGISVRYTRAIIINRKGAPLFKLEPWESNGAPRAVYTDEDFTSEDAVSAPGSLANTPKDQIFVSEVQQDMSGPHVKLIAPLRDAAQSATREERAPADAAATMPDLERHR